MIQQGTEINEKRPIFLAIDFLGVFFSILKTKNKNVVSSKQLFDTVGKYSNKYMGLFLDIDIRNNCGIYRGGNYHVTDNWSSG